MRIIGRCSRCGAGGGPAQPVEATTVSFFNTDEICMRCKDDEQRLPTHAAAHAAEIEQVRQGNFNFPGVGLSPADTQQLAAWRAERTPPAPSTTP